MDIPVLDITAVAAAVEGCSLPKPEWTHQAHLAAGLAWVHRHGLEAAIPHARASIRRYNEATGVANTDHGGYHETITRYYLTVLGRHAVARRSFPEVLVDPATSHDAVLRHWSTATLFSVAARRTWVPPDLVALVA